MTVVRQLTGSQKGKGLYTIEGQAEMHRAEHTEVS